MNMKRNIKNIKKIKRIKALLYISLILFLLYILYLMFLQPYTKYGTHLMTKEECDNSYDCKCQLEDEIYMWCTCKYKKWFIEFEGNCMKIVNEK